MHREDCISQLQTRRELVQAAHVLVLVLAPRVQHLMHVLRVANSLIRDSNSLQMHAAASKYMSQHV